MTVIEDYIKTAPTERQAALRQMYHLIKECVPEASEKISYGMPTFFLNGNLVHFTNAKNHLGLYPTPSAIEAFQTELTSYKTSKGAVQLPYDQELPVDLIKRMVAFRVRENLAKKR